jgi:hypothetical protein
LKDNPNNPLSEREEPGRLPVRQGMRGFLVACVSLVLLLAASWVFWQFRYEEYPGYARMALRPGADVPYQVMSSPESIAWDSASGRLSIRAATGESPTVEMDWDSWPRDGYAHVRIAGRAVGLIRGTHDWNDGRVVVVWRNDDGSLQRGCAGLLGVRGDDFRDSDVIVPLSRTGHPSVTFQNLGVAGMMTIERMEVTLVRQRWWGWGAVVGLLAGWFIWSFLVMRRWVAPVAGRGRLAVAGVLTVVALYFMILPGPWVPYRWIVSPFVIGAVEQSGKPLASPSGAVSLHGGIRRQAAVISGSQGLITDPRPNVEVPGKLLSSKFWEMVYALKAHIRWLLHLSIFAGMAVILVAVLRTPRAAFPVIAMAVATEAMETLFGFGFDGDDVIDLVMDGAGIWLGVWAMMWWLGRRARFGYAGNASKM